MAKQKNNLSSNLAALQETIHADTYGIDKRFLDEQDKIVRGAGQSITSMMSRYGAASNNKSGSNPTEELSLLVSKNIRTNTLDKAKFINNNDEGSNGFRSISYSGQMDTAELDVINSNSILFQSFFSTVQEYKNVVNLIPEVDRVIKIITRDVLNPSELTKRAFNNVYEPNAELNIDEKTASKINENIIKEVIDKNQLEKKAKKWVYESAIAGVKPIAIIPYSQIISQLTEYDSRYKTSVISDFKKGAESLNTKSLFRTAAGEESFKEYAFESNISKIDDVDTKERLYHDIIDDELLDKYYDFCKDNYECQMESYIESIDNPNNLFSTESAEIGERVEKTKTDFKDWKTSINKMPLNDRRNKLRDKLKTLVDYIDDTITVVKPEASLVYEANKTLRQKDRYNDLKSLSMKAGKSPDDIMKMNISGNNPLNRNGDIETDMNDNIDGKKMSIMEEAIVVEYTPEAVIPIMVGSEYVGFYAVEYESMYGPEWKSKRRTSSFTDFISSTGYHSDGDMTSGGGLMTTNAKDPIEGNAFSPVSLFSNNATKYMSRGSSQDDLKTETLKAIVLKTLSRKLKDPELVENKAFKDAVMNLLRNDYIVKKQIQFTFIPPENMIYMTYNEDEFGIPKSIMDGTLFFAYMYISSTISSLMIKLLKSSDKEKLEVNVGMSKEIGMTIAEIQRNLSTRTLYTQSLFNNMGSVLRNSSIYQRVIVPIIKGEKLYDVTPLDRIGNIDPDDDFTNKLLQSVLLKIGIQPSMMSILEDADFAKSIMMRNEEYRNNIIEEQSRYEPYFTKLIKLLTTYSTLPKAIEIYKTDKEEADDKNNSQKDDAVDNRVYINNIKSKFNPPNYLVMTSITDNLTTAGSAIDEISKAFNIEAGSGVQDQVNKIFRKEMYKKLVTNIDWSDIEQTVDSATKNAIKEYAKIKKSENVSNGIDNPPSDEKVDDQTEDTTTTSDSNDGSGESTPDVGGGDDTFDEFNS